MTVPQPVRCHDIEWRIYANLDGSNWTHIPDVLDDDGIDWDRGIDGGGPLDRTARAGTLTFSLINSHANSVGIAGYYSTGHVACRLGWNIGTPVRLDIAYQGVWQTQWIGRVDEVRPEHGILGTRRVFVVAKDWMEEAAEHALKGLATLDNVTAPEIIEEILAVIPIQPPGGTVLDSGLDIYPLAFDDVRDGSTRAISEFAKLALSGIDYIFVTKEGALRYQNRHARLVSTNNLFILDGTMLDVTVARRRRTVVNRIEVTVHPRQVDTNYAVLWSLDDKPLIAPGATVTFRGDFADPENPAERIGAVDVQTPLVAGQDYIASLQQAVAAGTPDTPATLRPNGDGFYTGSGAAADLADESDSTGIAYPGAFIKRSVALTDVSAAGNAAVSSVRVKVRINYTAGAGNIDGSGYGGFFVFYPFLRLNGIDAPMYRTGTQGTLYDAYNTAVHEVEFEAPTPPGGGVWTVSAINAAEFVWQWNIGGDVTALSLARVEKRLLYASAVEELDRTDDFTVVTTASGNAAEFAVTNNGTEGAYLTRLQIRGRPVRKYDPVTSVVEDAASIASIGERLVRMDQSYQADVNKGTSAADYLLDLYGGLVDRADSVSFLANLSEEHMLNALDREIGDRIGLIEGMTGLSAFTANGSPAGWYIQRIAGRIEPGPVVSMTWGLAPADSQQYWHAGVTGATEAGTGTVAGPI